MQATIITIPKSSFLSPYVEYFLFLKNNGNQGSYKTFANTNTCLAFYKESKVEWCRENNICEVTNGSQLNSKLFGFHNKPFFVNYTGSVDQVCIIFKTAGLRMFSKTPLDKIDPTDSPFEQIFGKETNGFVDFLFSAKDEIKQVNLLEKLLEKHIRNENYKSVYLHALTLIDNYSLQEDAIVKYLSNKMNLNCSTIYRNFLSLFGQSPIEFYKTIRFRKALTNILSHKNNFTDAAYSNNFFDQSHFIKDIKQFTGETPTNLLKTISQVEGGLIWSKK